MIRATICLGISLALLGSVFPNPWPFLIVGALLAGGAASTHERRQERASEIRDHEGALIPATSAVRYRLRERVYFAATGQWPECAQARRRRALRDDRERAGL